MPVNLRRMATWILASLLLAFSTPVRAQQASTASPDSARLAAAHRALQAAGTVDVMIATMRAALPAQRAAMPQVPAEFWTKFEARVVQDAPQLLDSIVVLYARSFSAEDLNRITAVYSSPAGQHLKQLQPSLVTQAGAIGQRWGARIGAEVGASIQQ